MINNKSIAIAIVDTHQHKLAANALYHSVANFPFDQVLIYSDIDSFWAPFHIIKIDPIKSISEYNEIIIKRLSYDLICDFVLIIQYDGFIINPLIFENIFLEYDYIGAPWNHLHTNNVGNGGFSLRSKLLVSYIAEIDNINYDTPEDVLICQQMRENGLLSSFKFAPLAVASKFSFEFPVPQHQTFGFHGVFNLPLIYRNNLDYLIRNLSDITLVSKFNYLYPIINLLSSNSGDFLKIKYLNLK